MRQARNPISVNEAAERLGVTAHAVRKWIRLRRMPFLKLGRRVLLDPADVEKLLRAAHVPVESNMAVDGR
jgi:excisionase family DNA binding protein